MFLQSSMDLYRGDGLIVLNKVTSQKTDKIRKKIIQVFKDNGFSIDIVTNLVEVNFVDVTFNLKMDHIDLIQIQMMSLSISVSCLTTHPRF